VDIYRRNNKMSNSIIKEIREWILSIIIAAVIAFSIKAFVFDIIEVSGTSMVPTLHHNDTLAIEKISLYTHSLQRGEIVIFDPGSKGVGIYIKRIIGLPGDTVEIKDGYVSVNGQRLEENYLRPGTVTEAGNEGGTIKVPDGEIYVLGDNREISEDSRYIGTVPIKSLKGHALYRVFPFNQMSTIK
jgi:signal peptidase I